VKTFGFLVGGWVLGGAIIVLCGAGSLPPVPRAAGPRAIAPDGTLSKITAAEPAAARQAGGLPRNGAPAFGDVLLPVQGVLASSLHDDYDQPRSDGRTHHALDILAPYGTPVIAAVDGTIRKLFFSGAGGITIYQFDRGENRVYYYAHLDRYANGLAEGMFVPQGTVIGYVGTTGNAHGTPHLHFAVEVLPPTKEWWKGTPINPYPLLATTRLSALP
jgi:murein DD-endopeptidase MepM/ murein hydrolase activator NlpD